jgi:hypothetical protein
VSTSAKQVVSALGGLYLSGRLTERQLHAGEGFAADMAARAKVARLREILLSTGDIDTGRRVWHAVMEVAVMDNQACRTWPDHMIGYLRRGLNRLADFGEEGGAA